MTRYLANVGELRLGMGLDLLDKEDEPEHIVFTRKPKVKILDHLEFMNEIADLKEQNERLQNQLTETRNQAGERTNRVIRHNVKLHTKIAEHREAARTSGINFDKAVEILEERIEKLTRLTNGRLERIRELEGLVDRYEAEEEPLPAYCRSIQCDTCSRYQSGVAGAHCSYCIDGRLHL